MDLSLAIDKVITLSPVSLAIALIAVVATIAYFAVASKGLPPGPTGVPFLGYWPFLRARSCHLQLTTLKKKYGDVFSFTCSGRLYIHLGTAKALREAHITKGDCFGLRVTEFTLFSHIFKDGVAFTNGEPWKVLRKFFLQVLKERGMASIKDSMSTSMYDSMNSTIEHLRKKNEEPEDIVMLLTDKCNAILRQTLFGDSGMSQEQIQEINEHYAALTDTMTPTNMLLIGNVAKILLHLLPGTRASMKHLDPIERTLYKVIDEHKSSYNEEHSRDMIDDFLKERNLRRSKGDPTAQYFTDKALMASLIQILGDGVLGIAVFVASFLKNIIQFPEEQEKMYQELVEVVGVDRQPTIEDKSKLTYTNAFILEVLRTSDFFPVFPSQECIKETTLQGFRIPVGAITLMNSWSTHYDPEVYQEPEKFNPSRYISKEGGKRAELPVTFGIGKRSCIGEGFTMMQVFLFLTSIVKNFKLTLAKDSDVLLDVFYGKMEVCAHPRNQK